MTVFRNVIDMGRQQGLVDLPVPADLGFSWRPDKPNFFPSGGEGLATPPWMEVAEFRIVDSVDASGLAEEFDAIRAGVAQLGQLGEIEAETLRAGIRTLAAMYQEHFSAWLQTRQVDWVFALNMTLSDAVPVTAGLHAATADYFGSGRPGGVLFWDHDLFGSCAIRDPNSGSRLYPETPNLLTPLPQRNGFTRWVVVSDRLAKEAASYPTDLVPEIVPNVLPALTSSTLGGRGDGFARQLGLEQGRPILLDPVRVFRIKGVDVAVELLAAMKEIAQRRGTPVPYLLVFGSLGEDPEYACEVRDLTRQLGIDEDVRFLDGVPLTTYRDRTGRWRLDELDLLRLAAATDGGVLFTPSVPDVETVGLGPALAGITSLPCALTNYCAFDDVYGPSFNATRVGLSPPEIRSAAEEYADVLERVRADDPTVATQLRENERAVRHVFPEEPWRTLWRELAAVT